jgi:membrane-bound metal-dependent hydrolase YbcI (DUF457 family)
MPLTPFHFGPHATVVLPLARRLDLPAFLLANIAADLEPLTVMVTGGEGPLHGYVHSFLLGALACAVCGWLVFLARARLAQLMIWLRLPYIPTRKKAIVSAILGGWLHIITDAPLYADVRPFWPLTSNPLYGLVSDGAMYSLCAWLFIPALLLYLGRWWNPAGLFSSNSR